MGLSLVFGIIVMMITIAICIMIVFADMMQPAPQPSNQINPLPVLIIGVIISGIIISSHWWNVTW